MLKANILGKVGVHVNARIEVGVKVGVEVDAIYLLIAAAPRNSAPVSRR